MNKYDVLVNILDKICDEAPLSLTRYHPKNEDSEEIYFEKKNQARSRALIHLYLQVSFGMLNFQEREYFITDNAYDGGIDGYFIDSESKTIHFIQSKFRTSEKNFTTKNIQLEEILAMDVNRVLDGEEKDENGNDYNGKIKQLIRDIRKLEDISRYRYKVVVIANLLDVPESKLKVLTGGFPVDLFDYEKCYQKLVFPVVSGTYFNASDLSIFIDLSNKNAGAKISYSVKTQYKDCEITVLFVPTIEIAKILYKYKNSILKYNPRSYLEFEGKNVNNSIRTSILDRETNEFALFNNGITMLSDETYINEKIGQKNKAHLTVRNPQIINGGQTAFNLSKIYEENVAEDADTIFKEKEVLLKIITFIQDDEDVDDEKKLELIEEISTATNKQTSVSNADRLSNEKVQYAIQKKLFDSYGVFYERKRGEFSDGLSNNYIKSQEILERNLFYRLYYCSRGNFQLALRKRLFQVAALRFESLNNAEKMDRFYFSYLCYNEILATNERIKENYPLLFEKIYILTLKYFTPDKSQMSEVIKANIENYKSDYSGFNDYLIKKYSPKYTYENIDKSGNSIKNFNYYGWRRTEDFKSDYQEYFLPTTPK